MSTARYYYANAENQPVGPFTKDDLAKTPTEGGFLRLDRDRVDHFVRHLAHRADSAVRDSVMRVGSGKGFNDEITVSREIRVRRPWPWEALCY